MRIDAAHIRVQDMIVHTDGKYRVMDVYQHGKCVDLFLFRRPKRHKALRYYAGQHVYVVGVSDSELARRLQQSKD